MPHNDRCIFCKIARGAASATTVYEDELTLAFMDINPASDGHLLIISKEHYENLLEIEEAALNAVMQTTQRLARAIQQSLNPDGMRISQFNGAAAGQTVFHYHNHIVPVRQGERPGAHGRGPGDSEVIQQIAERIRQAL
ncbi:MAG: HIT family protein [Candidatus Competibacteraceae bacterium]|nr:HIT family protein [Candidatus Competibacteraceae bacterium]